MQDRGLGRRPQHARKDRKDLPLIAVQQIAGSVVGDLIVPGYQGGAQGLVDIGTKLRRQLCNRRILTRIVVIHPVCGSEVHKVACCHNGRIPLPVVLDPGSSLVGHIEIAGAEAVIAGCTEISLVPGDGMSIRWIDALDCLVEATIREAGGRPLGEEA